jgi:hypothetical protein
MIELQARIAEYIDDHAYKSALSLTLSHKREREAKNICHNTFQYGRGSGQPSCRRAPKDYGY